MVCDKVVSERWCVKDGVSKMVCGRWCVTKMVCDKDDVWKMVCDKVVWQRWCVKDAVWKMVSERWCLTKWCVKDAVWRSCVWKMVCVNHLNRCKTSTCFFDFQIYSLEVFASCPKTAGGAGGTDETVTSKDTHQLPVIPMGTLIDVPYLHVSLQWQPAKPRTGMSNNGFLLFLLLHCCRNLSTEVTTWFRWISCF